jgi:hypothetical protein
LCNKLCVKSEALDGGYREDVLVGSKREVLEIYLKGFDLIKT